MKYLAAVFGIVVLLLQYRLWMSADGVRELTRLETAVAMQRSDNERLTDRNAQLAAEVRDLKKGSTALEERARSDLGMIASNETFYQVVPPHTSETSEDGSRVRTAAR
jgi:cell division protein FtsB